METHTEPVAGAESQPAKSRAALEADIARRPRELWEQRGRADGHAEEDWLQAEAEVTGKAAPPVMRRIVIRAGGTVYVGEHEPAKCAGYKPGDLKKGDAVKVRLVEDKMVIAGSNGEGLEAKIVKKVN